MPQLPMPLFDAPVPFNGNTPAARHASFTGAVVSAPTRGEKTSAYLQLLKHHGPLTDHQVAAITKWPLSSVNSIRNGIIDAGRLRHELVIEKQGFDQADWGDGKVTRRVQWGLVARSTRANVSAGSPQ